MKHMVNGKIVELVPKLNGSINSDDLRRAGDIEDDRQLILQLPDGNNRVVNAGEDLDLPPDQFFVDAPQHERGDWKDNFPHPLPVKKQGVHSHEHPFA